MAKKAAAKKKSTEAKPAAKKAATGKKKAADGGKKKAVAGGEKKAVASGKKQATRKASRGSAITQQDLAQVYAKAWTDEAFRTLLETDPTAALKQYAAENGLVWTKLVPIPASAGEVDENCIHLVSCC